MKKKSYFRKLIYLAVLLCLGYLPNTFAQCDTLAAEIPNNGVDEDCDGLDDFYAHLPPYIYTVVGKDFELYFRNIILSKQPGKYQFSVTTTLPGTFTAAKWSFTPSTAHIGEHDLQIKVKSSANVTLATVNTKIRVSLATLPANSTPKRLLLFGHSFFDQGYLPLYIHQHLQESGNPSITMVGKKQSWALPAARYEGLGGTDWKYFASNAASPFFYNGQINMRDYFDDVVGVNQNPDWIVIHLDINDFCGFTPMDSDNFNIADSVINNRWDLYANPIINAFKATAPNVKIAICYTPPPNARESSFSLTFPGNAILNNRWRWQKIVSRLLLRNTARYANRENENIFLIPIYLDIDDFNEYPTEDARHPEPDDNNAASPNGYKQIAKSIYAWIKYAQYLPTVSTQQPKELLPFVQVSPNPSEGTFVVQLPIEGHQAKALNVYTADGRLVINIPVLTESETQIRLNIDNQSAGYYFLEVVFEQGYRHTQSIVKF